MNKTMKDNEIVYIKNVYNDTKSIKATAAKCNISWNRVVKILSTGNIIINNTHAKIIELYNQNKSAEEIANVLKMSVKTVQSYLPAVRPIYRVNQSENAVRISEWRKNKNDIKDGENK